MSHRAEALSFSCGGVTHAATLYLPAHPEGERGLPAVVTAPGLGGVKEMLIPEYGRALADAGIACLAFDYAGFGASDGEVRQHADPRQQVEAFSAALRVLADDPRFDAGRLGVWGTSMAGGHALSVAATDPLVRCVVSLIPFIRTVGRAPLWLVKAIAINGAGAVLGRGGGTVALAGPPGTRALMTTDGAGAFIQKMAARAPRYVNELTLASLPRIARYDTADAARSVGVPLLVVLAGNDTINPPELVHEALGRPNRETVRVHTIDSTHFELFDERRQETVSLLVDWFGRYLS